MKSYLYILLYLPMALAWTSLARGAGPAYRIETVAGSGSIGDGGPATAAQIANIQGVAVDSEGNLYLSDTANHRVRKVSADGVIATVAGTGLAGFSGDNGPAIDAQVNLPYGLAVDAAGSLYVADLGNNRVRRIAPDGAITTVAGTGRDGPLGDGGAATDAVLLTPRNVALDAAGNLYISEFFGHRVRKVSPDGKIITVAGIGVAGFSGDSGPAASAQLGFPAGLAVNRNGILFIADSQNKRVRKVSGGIISTALNGSDVNSAIGLFSVDAVAVDASGTLYVADGASLVQSCSAAGTWTAIAGNGNGGDGPAVSAYLTSPQDLALDLTGNLFIADGVRVREVDSQGQIRTVAGDGYLNALGDGGLATAALLSKPSAVALDAAGTLYIADTGTERVRQVLPFGLIRTLAGTGIKGKIAGQASVALAAATALYSPMGVAVDRAGNVVIADTLNHSIRQVGADGLMRTLVGTGTPGTGAEGLQPDQMPLNGPQGVCFDHTGAMFIVDTSNHRVLRAAPADQVFTAAGNGAPGDAGDGGIARLAQLKVPSACALNSAGDLFIADTGSNEAVPGGNRIRKVTSAGIITTVAGTGTPGFSGDEGLAVAASLNAPRGVAVDDGGNIFIADTGNNRIRQVTPDGVIHTIAGQDSNGFFGDGGPAQAAQLDAPGGLFLDASGALYVADTNNNRIRRLVPGPALPPPVALPAALAAVNAASQIQGPVAPGEIVSIFGSGIGPADGVSGTFDSAGLLASVLAGSEVRFDGVPAPLFYAQSGQINVQVPYTVNGNSLTHMEVFYQGQSSGTLDLPLAAATPALFAIAVNQDGAINSETSPAPRGTILTFFATGEGLTDGPNISGKAAAAPYPRPLLPATLAIAGINAELLYAGSIPGGAGVLQVNARVPSGFVPPGLASVDLAVGGFAAPAVTVWLK